MTYVVTESCIKCKYTDCVEVCPVDCFKEGDEFLIIDPEICIDCGVCVEECPVRAIEEESKDNLDFLLFAKENSAKWPVITKKKEALKDADHFKDVKNKKHYLF